MGAKETNSRSRSAAPARTDVAVRLRERVGPYANVAAPADLVALPADRAAELVAAVEAAVDNARRHAGAGAGIWILLEQEGGEVVVAVRDDGVGIPAVIASAASSPSAVRLLTDTSSP